MTGYTEQTMGFDRQSSSARSSNYHAGLYGGTEWGNIALRGGFAYTWHDLKSTRALTIPGLAQTLSANYSAGTLQAFGELGYQIDLGASSFEPFFNLAQVNLRTDGFTETGGSAALSGTAQSNNVTLATLGLRGNTDIAFGAVAASLDGMVGWQYGMGDLTPTSTQAFAGSDSFTVAGVPMGRHAALVEAGLTLSLSPIATLRTSYDGRFAADSQNHSAKANLAVAF